MVAVTTDRRLPWRHRAGHPRVAPYLLALPVIVIVVSMAVIPLLYGVFLSFTDWSLLTSPAPRLEGISTYRELFGSTDFYAALWRTLLWTAGTLGIELGVGLPLALLLHRRTPVTGFVTGLILLPWVTPFAVVSYAWLFLFDGSYGPLHSLLEALHLAGPVSPLGDPDRALWAVTAISGWKGLPFMTVALLAARKGIPEELYEAAGADGAGPWQRFRLITLPLLRNTMMVMGLTLSVMAFYSFDLVWLTTKGGPGDATTLLGVELYHQFFAYQQPGYAATIGTVSLVLLAAAASLTLWRNRRVRRS